MIYIGRFILGLTVLSCAIVLAGFVGTGIYYLFTGYADLVPAILLTVNVVGAAYFIGYSLIATDLGEPND